jgi:PAS domain S-box-containing protein
MFKAPVWYLLLLGISSVFAVATLVRVRREGAGGITAPLQVLLVAVVVWMTMALLDNLGISPGISYTFTKLTYLGIPTVATAWFLVALEYTDRGDFASRRLLVALAIEPILVNVAVWTNDVHELFWELDWSRAVTPIVDGGHGVLFFVHAVYLYVLTMAGVIVVADVIRRRERLFQRQSVVLGVCALVPLVANVLFIAQVVDVDPTPPAFLVSGVLFYWVVARGNVAAVSPIARQTVIDTMGAAMFVVSDGRLVDVNRQGRRLLGADEDEDVVGAPVSTLLDDFRLFSRFDDVVQGTETITVDTGFGQRHYEVEVSPVLDDDDRVGRLFLVQDVTDRVERQRELERKNEQMEGFASVVSHDLRNPLTVAAGYVETIESVTDDDVVLEYAAEVSDAHDRMETLIEDILTMAREGETVEDPEPVSLWTVARSAWRTVDTGAMTLEPADDATTDAVVLGDADRLQRLFENCFRNAREHAGDDVTVTIGADSFDTETVLSPDARAVWVADDGPGIPESEREAVLEEGYTTDEDGTGFGLAIVREIAEGHGWSVSVGESAAGGAVFRFEGVATTDRTEAAPARED